MIALEWISKLTYIPHMSKLGDDYPQLIMKNFSDYSNMIQLKNYGTDFSVEDMGHIDYETQYEVPFEIILKHDSFRINEDIDYVFFSQYPSYTPASADVLLDIFKEYIDFENFRDSII